MDSFDVRWLPVKGMEGMFEVSSDGRIRRLDHVLEFARKDGTCKRQFKAKEMRQYFAGAGYKVWIRQGTHYTHRTVAEAFIGSVEGMTVNHIDFDKTNNHANNLEIVTQEANMRHAIDGGRNVRGESHGRVKATESQVRRCVELIRGGMSRRRACEETGMKIDAIEQVLWGNNWRHLGLSIKEATA
jgi:hypothetical protein